MTTVTVELPDRLAAQLATDAGTRQRLQSFLVGAIEVWLRRQGAAGVDAPTWSGAFEGSATKFVDQLFGGRSLERRQMADLLGLKLNALFLENCRRARDPRPAKDHPDPRPLLASPGLKKVDLKNADLKGFSLKDADLEGVCLWDADLRGVDLRGNVYRVSEPPEGFLEWARPRFGALLYRLVSH